MLVTYRYAKEINLHLKAFHLFFELCQCVRKILDAIVDLRFQVIESFIHLD